MAGNIDSNITASSSLTHVRYYFEDAGEEGEKMQTDAAGCNLTCVHLFPIQRVFIKIKKNMSHLLCLFHTSNT